jgi:hypothetical protein
MLITILRRGTAVRKYNARFDANIITRDAPKGGGGCRPAAPPPNRNLKNTDFVHKMISNILSDLPLSRNKSLKAADDEYIRILKNKINLDDLDDIKSRRLGLLIYELDG